MRVKLLYFLTLRKYQSQLGLAESLLKKKLERAGWVVWRSDALRVLKKEEIYPNVQRKYELLQQLLPKEKFEYLQYLTHIHHGMPDFFCYRYGRFKFVECKLNQESVKKNQLMCMAKVLAFGFPVEVHVLVTSPVRSRVGYLDLDTGKRHIIERQERLKKKY